MKLLRRRLEGRGLHEASQLMLSVEGKDWFIRVSRNIDLSHLVSELMYKRHLRADAICHSFADRQSRNGLYRLSLSPPPRQRLNRPIQSYILNQRRRLSRKSLLLPKDPIDS